MSEQAIIRVLAEKPMTTPQVQMRLSATLAKPHTAQMLLNLQARGMIMQMNGNRWQPTERGYAMLPKTAPVRNWGKYVPPVHVRREGSEVAAKLPSLFAGARIWR